MTNKLVSVDATTFALPDAVQGVLNTIIDQRALALIPAVNPQQALMIGDGSATIPVRPTTTLPVIFNTTTFVPTTGSIAGGTRTMVAGLDLWIGSGGSGGGSNVEQYVLENPAGSGTYPNRPATTNMVAWKGVVAPSGGGTTAGGTALMVNGLDEFHQYVTS